MTAANTGPERSTSQSAENKVQSACGNCTACCIWLPISAGHVGAREKPAGVPCPWVCPSGCRDYAHRPKICRDFLCSYLKFGDWPLEWRPDQSQLLCLTETLPSGEIGSAVYELAAGQILSEMGKKLLASLKERSNFVVVITHDGQRIFHAARRVDMGHQAPTRPYFLEKRGSRSQPLSRNT